VPRQLWFLRHGEAVPHGATSDADRELTPVGERQAESAGRALARLGVEFDHCFTSPRVRAVDTARLACEGLGTNFEIVASMSAGFDAGDLREVLQIQDGDGPLLFVGHEPDFSQLAFDLTGARIELEKAGLFALAGDRLLVLLRPRELASLAGLPGQ
jgi:phosphohistidine phosphatase